MLYIEVIFSTDIAPVCSCIRQAGQVRISTATDTHPLLEGSHSMIVPEVLIKYANHLFTGMAYHKWFLTVAVVGVVLVGTVSLVTAHETKTVNGYELTFGGSDEPVITGERMWLQVEIIDNETGEPVTEQEDSLEMAVQRPFGNDTFELEVESVYDRPGWYEGAVVFTEPGTYTVYINGSINGTDINTSFSKKVHDASELEYPDTTDTQDSRFGSDVFTGFGLGALTTALALGAVVLIGRRIV